MVSYSAAAGDTWGISGPTFLWIFLLLGVVIVIGTLVNRQRVQRGPLHVRANAVTGQEAAYLNGGPRLAVYASLGALRTAGAIGVSDDGVLAQTGTLPAGSTPLDVAVYQAADRRIRPRALLADRWVGDAIGSLREGLDQSGLAVSAKSRRSARSGALVLLALLAFGVVRLVAGVSNKRPVGLLAMLLAVLGVVIVVLLVNVPRRTAAADFVLTTLRFEHRNLAPVKEPAWSTYGPAGAAMGVALFGSAALWTADPAFAAAADVKREFAAAHEADKSLFGAGSGGSGAGYFTGGSHHSSGGGGDGGGGGGGGGCGG
jgi:uncharacterized protein (TIGR04222 family)